MMIFITITKFLSLLGIAGLAGLAGFWKYPLFGLSFLSFFSYCSFFRFFKTNFPKENIPNPCGCSCAHFFCIHAKRYNTLSGIYRFYRFHWFFIGQEIHKQIKSLQSSSRGGNPPAPKSPKKRVRIRRFIKVTGRDQVMDFHPRIFDRY